MTIILRSQKGAPLTHEELDGNFQDLITRIASIDTQETPAEGIASISLEGREIIVRGTMGSLFGRFALPRPRLAMRGSWATKTPYCIDDVVQQNDKLYLCQSHHTSGKFDSEQEHWTLFFTPPSRQENATTLPTYSLAMLPTPTLGSLALFLQEGKTSLIFGDGETWKHAIDGTIIHKGRS